MTQEFRKALEKLVTKMKNHDHKGREKAARRQEDRKKKQSRDKARRDHLKMAYQARNVGAVGKLVDQQETEIVEAEMPHKRPKKARVYTSEAYPQVSLLHTSSYLRLNSG